jgi:hypothetical protein
MSDKGCQDRLRLRIVECLLLLHISGCRFLDFPNIDLTASAVNSMRILVLAHANFVSDQRTRALLVSSAFILIFRGGGSLVEWEITPQEYPELCRPLMRSIHRPTGPVELETFFLPLALHYFTSPKLADSQKPTAAFVKNLLTAANYFAGTDALRIVLLLLALISQTADDALWEKETDGLLPTGPVAHRLLGQIIVEVALRVARAKCDRHTAAALALLLTAAIPRTKRLLPGVWAELIAVVEQKLEFAGQRIVVEAITWALGNSMNERIGLASEVLMAARFFEDLAAAHPDCEAVDRLVAWVKREIARAHTEGRQMAIVELREWLTDARNLETIEDASSEPPTIQIDLTERVGEFSCMFAELHFAQTTGIHIKHSYSE